MNCDLILTADSCRFCLGESGTNISIQGSYFLVEKRLVQCKQIFDFLRLSLKIDENQSLNVPKNICHDCKKTIVAFYALRKNFLDNEAVLMGKIIAPEEPAKNVLMEEIEEFLTEHQHEQLVVKKYADQLVIRPAEGYRLLNCIYYIFLNGLIFRNEIRNRSPSYAELNPGSIFHKPQEDLDTSSIDQTDDEELMYETQNEEYLEQDEDDSLDCNDEAVMDTDEVQLDIKKDSKQYECQLCYRKFASRSGRDTHNQLKHKAPNVLDSTLADEHEIEVDHEDGTITKAWRCPICQRVSKKKNHHQTHITRHAIRETDEAMKQGIQQGEFTTTPMSSEATKVESKPEIKKVLSRVPVHHPSHINTADDHFSCSRCKSKFADVEDANSHIQKYAKTGMCKDCFCKDCSVVFSSQKLYKRHITFHEVSPIAASLAFPVCKKCQIVFGSPKDLEVHLGTNHLCETDRTSQLEGAELLIFDLQSDMSSENYRCGNCVKTGTKDEIYLHITLFHGSLVCPIDKQEFARSTGYFLEHMKSKHPDLFGVELSFKCAHCVQIFSSKEARDDHCLKCDSKKFQCSHCEKKFAFERQLKRHISLVEGIKSHKCYFCDKCFVNRTELNVHSRVHTNERPYFCSFPGCGKTFRTNSHRSSHMDTHNTEKNFKCSECEEVFQTRSLRRIHEKSHITGSISCELCPKEFGQRSHYVRHVNKVHHLQCTSLNLEETIRQFNNRKEVV